MLEIIQCTKFKVFKDIYYNRGVRYKNSKDGKITAEKL